MTLKYLTKKEISVKHIVKPYISWGMYTKRGNKKLQDLATNLMVVATAYDKEKIGIIRLLEGIFTFISEYRALDDMKTYGEAGDTAVRETVQYFIKEILASVGIETDFIGHVWNNRKSFPPKKEKK